MKRVRQLCRQRKLNFAALCILVLAVTALAGAESREHKGKQGYLRIKVPTEFGGTSLEPGDYLVREVDSPDEVVVEIVRETSDSTEDGISWSHEMMARIPVSEQALDTRSKHTQLEFGPGAGRAVALEIKGDTAKYLLEPASEANTAGAMANQAESSR